MEGGRDGYFVVVCPLPGELCGGIDGVVVAGGDEFLDTMSHLDGLVGG